MSPADDIPNINAGYELAVTPPEEGALAAYNAVRTGLLDALGIATVNLPMDMASRIQTNSQCIAAASAYVNTHPNVTYVKGPGVTPRDKQTIDTIMWLEQNEWLRFAEDAVNAKTNEPIGKMVAEARQRHAPHTSPANLRSFATEVKQSILSTIGSPNAAWRDVQQVNLARGTSDALAARSQVTPPAWNNQTPLTTYIVPADDSNRQTAMCQTETNAQITFLPDGDDNLVSVGSQKVSGGTPVRLFTANKGQFMAWADEKLTEIAGNQNATLAHGSKQTVLKTFDAELVSWLQQAIDQRGMQKQIDPIAQLRDTDDDGNSIHKPDQLGNLLVDDLFSRLSTKQLDPNKPLAILSPNPSYAQYVHDVWEGIKQAGGLKKNEHSEIVRASATGDHYKSIQFKAPSKGTLFVRDDENNLLIRKEVAAGDVAMFTSFDRNRVEAMLKQTLGNAQKSGRTNVIIGFDDDAKEGKYYAVARELVETLKPQFPNLHIETMNAADATVSYLTQGKANTTLVLNNIHGDFATDIEINGKGTCYSIGRSKDGRGVVELGSGGTAPDQLANWKKNGLLVFNPMSFIEGISLALGLAAENMDKNGARSDMAKAVSKALEEAIYATTDNGIVLPIINKNFSKKPEAHYSNASTQTFVKSVQFETLKALKGAHPAATDDAIATARNELDRMVAIDKAMFAARDSYGEEWAKANETWHNAREKAGKVDMFNPNYSIEPPLQVKIANITAENLLALQQARATLAIAKTPSDTDAAITSLKQIYERKLGIGTILAEIYVREDAAQVVPNALAAGK